MVFHMITQEYIHNGRKYRHTLTNQGEEILTDGPAIDERSETLQYNALYNRHVVNADIRPGVYSCNGRRVEHQEHKALE